MPDRHHPHYDAIVVGARAAGAATGMLLARAGLRVLVVDRAQYGHDTVSTHALIRAGVLQLHRWGVLEEVIAEGTPPIHRTTFQIGDERVVIPIKPYSGVDALYAPRRTVLDPILADAAALAGAEVRHGVTVIELRRQRGGRVCGIVGRDARGHHLEATAAIVVGADGMSSRVAQWVGAPVARTGAAAGAIAYGYWKDLDVDGFHWFFRPGAAAGAIPTNDGDTCVFVGTTPEQFHRHVVRDPLAGFHAVLADAAPELGERLGSQGPPEKLRLFPGRPGFVRRAWGQGWALVGDAGYFKDPISAHGLTDALRDAELLARAITAFVLDGAEEAGAFEHYQATRDRLSSALFTITDEIASYAWDVPRVGALLLELSSAMADEVEHLSALDAARPGSLRPTRGLELV